MSGVPDVYKRQVGTGADGIAEVIGRKPRHHGVEVNDADAFSGGGVD